MGDLLGYVKFIVGGPMPESLAKHIFLQVLEGKYDSVPTLASTFHTQSMYGAVQPHYAFIATEFVIEL